MVLFGWHLDGVSGLGGVNDVTDCALHDIWTLDIYSEVPEMSVSLLAPLTPSQSPVSLGQGSGWWGARVVGRVALVSRRARRSGLGVSPCLLPLYTHVLPRWVSLR